MSWKSSSGTSGSSRRTPSRPRRRGDDIPPVSDYSHWNEDAERMWYQENRYDMEHADEIVEFDDDNSDLWDDLEDE